MKWERVDNIGFGTLRLAQQPEDFCYGIDAVILADFAAGRMKAGGTVLDLGTGNGIIPLILSHKTKAKLIYGLEVQEEAWKLASRNVEMNGLQAHIRMICGDVRELGKELLPEVAGKVDTIVSNPPYNKYEAGLQNANPARTIARHEVVGTLDDFFAAAARTLKARGSLFMIHRTNRLADLIALGRAHRLEPKLLRMVAPRPGTSPNLVLLHFLKGGGGELKTLPTLYVYGSGGEYSPEILEIYEKKVE